MPATGSGTGADMPRPRPRSRPPPPAIPTARWISWIRNLQGRAYLDDGKPATAARILLANYQDNPRGERAADSLFYLGEALTRLNRRTEACRVYDELARVYPNMRDQLRSRSSRPPAGRPLRERTERADDAGTQARVYRSSITDPCRESARWSRNDRGIVRWSLIPRGSRRKARIGSC